MASGGGVSVASLWTEVNRCGQNGDYTRALKALTKSRVTRMLKLLSKGVRAVITQQTSSQSIQAKLGPSPRAAVSMWLG